MKDAPAVATITIITIIMPMKFSKASDVRLLKSLENRSFTIFSKASPKMTPLAA
jgi:hypothetical protein